jgi:hypothetical protein
MRHLLTVNAHVDGITHIAFAERHLVAAGSEGSLSIWDLPRQLPENQTPASYGLAEACFPVVDNPPAA